MAAGLSETVVVAEDSYCWGNIWLPAVLEAIGGFDGNSKVYGVRLHAEYGQLATVTILHGCGSELTRILPLRGTNWLSTALNAPRGLQAITIEIAEGLFVICHCRYAPIDTPVEAVVAALLKVSDDGST